MPDRTTRPMRAKNQQQQGVTNPQPKPQGKYQDLVDLSYLPDTYIKRIDDIFDGYFHLGMQRSNWTEMKEHSPQFPNKLSTLSSPQLGDELGKYTAWYAFAGDKLKYIAVAHNFIEQELHKTMEAELGGMTGDRGNIEAKKAKARSSEAYLLVYSYIQKLRGIKTLLELEMNNHDRCIGTLSREITRREHNAGF